MIAALGLLAALQDPAQALAEAVDLPDPAARRAAALALAQRKDVSLERWLDAAAAFAPAPGAPRSAGLHSLQVALPVGEGVETTTLHMYLPAAMDGARPAPLLLALHGAGGDGSAMLREWRASADALGMLVCAPTDPAAAGGYAFTPRERAAALAALRWTRRHYDVDENRVFLAGASRGGHLAWDLGLRHPDRWAGIAPSIGGPTFVISGGRNNLRYALNLAATPLRDLQGADDDPKLLLNLRIAFERLRSAGARDALLIEQPGFGHSYDPGAVDWTAWLGACARDPAPTEVAFRCAWPAPQRIAWARILRYEKGVQEEFPLRVADADWDSWDHERKVRHILAQADERTAELRARREADGALVLEGRGVARAALLLPQDWLDRQPKFALRAGGKERQVQPRRSARVLLLDFVERFDRRFLPVAEVEADF
jgi:poly(3-hydroxybutyrate) depolymerase